MHWHFDYGTNIRLSVEGNNGFEFDILNFSVTYE